jgi:hypothetical protein
MAPAIRTRPGHEKKSAECNQQQHVGARSHIHFGITLDRPQERPEVIVHTVSHDETDLKG